MCGICGVHDPGGVPDETVRRMATALAHRGPDDSGVHTKGPIGLGHRRLSIIGLDDGHQPMCNEDGSIWITFNGEIYNYRELANDLEGHHHFKTKSDTEVILHLYEDLGPDCVKRLRGMFAFAIYDSRDDSLFAARDHLGQKPFFYSLTGDRFAFASEIKGLLALDPGLRELDPEALCEYLSLRIITPPRSMFRRIRKLAPGHCLTYRRGELAISRYWELGFEPKRSCSFADAVDELDRRLQRAVEFHLVSDVPVGAFLSGGVDSSLIVAMMSRFTEPPLKSFTGDLPYGRRSELPYARRVAERYGTESHELEITPSLVDDLPDVIHHLDEPSDPLSVCLYSLSGLIRRQVKVVVGGDGGDELFGGYDRYYGNRFAGYLALLPRGLRAGAIKSLLGRMPQGSWYLSLGHKLRWLVDMSLAEGSARYARSLGYFYFSEDYRESLYTAAFRGATAWFDPEENLRRHFDTTDERQALDRMLYADSATRLPDHPVMILDRMTMAHGLEARSPFLDHELAEFCASLPPSFKIRGTRRRLIQIALAERYVPREVLERDKQGFSSAFPYMMADQFDLLYRTFLADSRLVDQGIFEQAAIERLLRDHQAQRADHGQRLWLLCNLEMWYRIYIDDERVHDVRDQIRNVQGHRGAADGVRPPEPREVARR